MRKILFLLVFVFGVLKMHAQVGIGTTTPDLSTQLHIVSGDRGILIPQVPLISTTDSLTIINGNVESLLVYATIAQNDIVPGYYYWYQNKWRKLTVSDDVPGNIVVWDIANNQFNFVDDQGNNQHIDIEEIIQLYETDTTITDNGDGTFTYLNEAGDLVTFSANTVTVSLTDGVYTFLDGAGNTITAIDTNASVLPYDNTASGLVATNVQAALDELAAQIGDLDLVDNLDGTFSLMAPDGITVLGTVSKSDLTDEGAGLFTFTNNDGSDVQFDVRSVEVVFDAASNVYNFLDAAGAVIASIDMNASNVAFDNTTSGLTATDVQAALDELATQIGDLDLVDNLDGTFSLMAPDGVTVLGTVSKSDLTDEGAGLFTFTNNDGSDVQFDVRSVEVVFDAASNSYNFLDSSGNIIAVIDLNATNLAYDNSTGGLTGNTVQAVIDELANRIGDSDLIDNEDGTFLLMGPDGTAVLGTVSKSALTDEEDGFFTFTNNDGSDVQFDVRSVEVTFDATSNSYNFLDSSGNVIAVIDLNASNVAYDNSTSGLTAITVQAAIDEIAAVAGGLSDTLVDNGDGTYTHTTVAGDTITIDANVVSVTVSNGVYTFLDGAGTTITTIDTNAAAIAYDNSTSGLAALTVQQAIDEIAAVAGGLSDTLVDNGDGTYTHTTVAGDTVTIDANTVDVTVVDGVYTFLDGAGATITTIDTNASAVAYDNATSGLTATNVQAAIDEIVGLAGGLSDTLVDNGDGTYTHTTVAGDAITIDANVVSVTVSNGVYTFLDGAGTTITTIDTNAAAIAYDNSTSGLAALTVQQAIDEIASVAGGLSDTLVDNGDGTYTHTTVAGDIITIDANVVSVTVSNGVYTFLDGAGTTITTIDTNAAAIAYDNSASGLTATTVQAAIDEIAAVAGGLSDTLVDNGDGTYTHTTVAGDTITIDANVVSVTVSNGVYTFLDGAGTTITTIDTNAAAIAYDNSTSGLAALTVQQAIDEIAAVAGGLSDTLVDNGDGTYTHTTVAGDTVTIDANTVDVTVVDGVYTFLDGAGATITTIDTNASAVAYDNATSGLTATNVQAAIDEIVGLAGGLSDTLVDNGDGTYTHTTVAGDAITIDANVVSVTVSNGVYTFLDGAGTTITTIDTNAAAIAYDNSTSGLAALTVQQAIDEIASVAGGLSDTLVDNGDGTYTHTTVAGDIITIDANVVSVTVSNGVYTFLDGAGTTITTIDTNAAAIAYDNSTSGLTATNVQAAIDEIVGLAGGLSDTLVDNGDGTYTHTTVAGDAITIDANVVSVTVSNGVYTFLDGAGTTITTIDTNAAAIAYDNSTSGLAALTVQQAIDEIASVAGGLSDTLVDNVRSTYTHTTVAGDAITIDANVVSVTVSNGVYTFLDGAGTTITTIDTNAAAIAYDNSTSGLAALTVQQAIDEIASVAGGLSDTLVDNVRSTYTHTTVAGDTITIDANVVSVTVSNGVYTFLDGAGTTITTIDTNAAAIAYDNSTSGLTGNTVQAAIDELATQIGDLDLIDNEDGTFSLMGPDGTTVLGTVSKSDLTDEGDGLFTFTNNDGSDVQFDVRSVEVTFDATSNSYNFLDSSGNVIAVIDLNASNVAYDNSTSGLAASNVQTAIDELATQIGDLDLIDNEDGTFSLMGPDGTTILGTVSKSDLTDEGDGLFTFTNNDGSDVQFDVRSVEVTFDATSNSYNFLDSSGNVIAVIDLNASNVAYDNSTSGLSGNTVQTAIDELATQIGDLDLIDNEDGTFSLMGPDGTTILGTVSKSDLTDEGDGLFTFTNNDGSDVQFDVRSVEVVFDAASNVYNFLDAAGNVIAVIDLNASNVAYDNSTSGLSGNTVQTAIDELATQIGDLDLID